MANYTHDWVFGNCTVSEIVIYTGHPHVEVKTCEHAVNAFVVKVDVFSGSTQGTNVKIQNGVLSIELPNAGDKIEVTIYIPQQFSALAVETKPLLESVSQKGGVS